jgi:uncharacterized protein YndB with AHSA1/START domain
MTADGATTGGAQLVRISRTLPAPPERVWAALTDAEQLRQWFWPSSFDTTVSADVRIGGRYRIASTTPEMAVGGEYLEVAAPERLVLSWQWDGEETSSTVRIDLLGDERGSGLVLTHEGLASDAVPEHQQGWSDCLDRLPGHLGHLG